YTLVIEGRFLQTQDTTYTFNVQPVADETIALSLNTIVTEAIDETGEQDHYTFTLASPQRLVFHTLPPSTGAEAGQLRWSLSGPRGAEIANRLFSGSDAANLGSGAVLDLPAGSYTLTVDGNGDQLGAYSFRLLNLTSAAPFVPGTPVTSSLTNGGRPAERNPLPTTAPYPWLSFHFQALGTSTVS